MFDCPNCGMELDSILKISCLKCYPKLPYRYGNLRSRKMHTYETLPKKLRISHLRENIEVSDSFKGDFKHMAMESALDDPKLSGVSLVKVILKNTPERTNYETSIPVMFYDDDSNLLEVSSMLGWTDEK